MATYVYAAVLLWVFASRVDAQCNQTYDSANYAYNVYCVDNINYYGIDSFRCQGDTDQFGNICNDNFNHNGYYYNPVILFYQDTEQRGLADGIPYGNYLMEIIITMNLSNREYTYIPNIKTMPHLATLDMSKNYLKVAKLSNINDLPVLSDIDFSHNTISDIVISNNEHRYEKLVNINLSHNYLVNIPEDILDAFAELKNLDLSHNFIDGLTPLTFEGVKNLLYLNMSYNRISNIDSSLFRFNKLISLSFEGNKLGEVKPSDFEKLLNLKSLDLSSNLISSVDANAFDNMFLLSVLDLSNNQLKTIGKQVFLNLSNLKEINLSLNHFKVLPRGMFKGKSILTFIILGNALTGSLVRGTFEGLQFVAQLDLSNQQLTSVEDFAFFGLENVRKILLNNNNIQSLSKNCFKTMQHLNELDLSQNKITNIDFYKEDLISLQSLLLRNNHITQVKYEYFQTLSSLQYLDLSYNNISHLDTDSFKSLKELINFEISNNPLSGALEENTFEGLNSLPSLDISRNMMTVICNNSFMSMVQLRELNVSFSQIEVLQYNAFRKTGAIQKIDLSFNKLKVFNINTTELTGLRTLLLNGNLLKAVGKNTLRGLICLTKITLGNNNILTIDEGAFTDQKDLRYLDLSYNTHLDFNVSFIKMNKNLNSLYLLGITSGTNFTNASDIPLSTLDISFAKLKETKTLKLQELTRLDTLVLNNNKITKLEVSSFENVKTLRTLDVSFNQILFIQPGTFKDNTLLYSLNISHNALTAVGYGIFRGLIYLHTLDMSYNEINSLQSERFYEVRSLSVLIADHNKIDNVNAEDFAGTSLTTLSIGENPLPCEILVNFKKNSIPFEVTAIRLEEKSDYENIDGVTCNMNRGSHTSSIAISDVNEVSNKILIDIRDILVKNNKFTESKNINTMQPNIETKYLSDTSNKIEKAITNSTNRLQSYMINGTSEVVNDINITNTFLGKILKVLSANWRTIYTPPLKENSSESLLPYIDGVKIELENSIAAEKEKINEINSKIAVIISQIDSMRTPDLPLHEKYVASEVQTQSESLFTKSCLALILSIMMCVILYKFYKSRMFIRNRLLISTRELPGAMEHSTL